MTTITLFVLLFLFLLTGMPIAIGLGLASVTTILFFSDDSIASITLKLLEALSEHYTLLAIPFFILSSAFLSTGGVAKRIIDFAINCVGYRRHDQGGLPGEDGCRCYLQRRNPRYSHSSLDSYAGLCCCHRRIGGPALHGGFSPRPCDGRPADARHLRGRSCY
ncbi:hypothetical protein ES705_46013 [subsurface metagenome]